MDRDTVQGIAIIVLAGATICQTFTIWLVSRRLDIVQRIVTGKPVRRG